MDARFSYLYRDGANTKFDYEVVFPGEFTPEMEARVRQSLDEGEYFVARQIGIPEKFPFAGAEPQYPYDAEADHCYHEFDGLELTKDTPMDPRSVGDFMETFTREGAKGWQAFDASTI